MRSRAAALRLARTESMKGSDGTQAPGMSRPCQKASKRGEAWSRRAVAAGAWGVGTCVGRGGQRV